MGEAAGSSPKPLPSRPITLQEIYNEEIRDLLGRSQNAKLELKETVDRRAAATTDPRLLPDAVPRLSSADPCAPLLLLLLQGGLRQGPDVLHRQLRGGARVGAVGRQAEQVGGRHCDEPGLIPVALDLYHHGRVHGQVARGAGG